MRRIKNLLRWLNVLIILVTFIAYLSPYINPERFWFIALLGTAYPWLLLANFLMAITWGLMKNRYFLFSTGCIILGWSHFTGFVGFHSQDTAGKEDLTVMTYNARGMDYLKAKDKKTKARKTKEFFNFLYSTGKPKIFCIQEVNNYHSQVVLDQMEFKYHHKIPYIGTAIFSQFPIVNKGNIAFKTRTNSCVWADLKIGEKTIRVYSIHLQSSKVSGDTEKVITEGQLKEKETWSNIGNILRKFKQTSKVRAQQAQKIAAHIEKSPHPVIVCGDFNETPQSYVYRLISTGLNDTFRKKGLGLGSTYAGKIPALRIDYILCDKKFKVLNNRILKKAYSDHYPVTSGISLK